MATTANGRTPKLTCPSPTTGARGLPCFHFHWRRGTTPQARDSFCSLTKPKPTGKSTSCAFPSPTSTPSQPEGTTQAYSPLQTTMEPLPHGLWSRSSESLTGWTGQAEGRFVSYWNHHYIMRYSLAYRTNTQPDKDPSYDDDDMPCRYTPLHYAKNQRVLECSNIYYEIRTKVI